MKLLKYEGYILEDAPLGYVSTIDKKRVKFKTAREWVEYIERLSASTKIPEKKESGLAHINLHKNTQPQ